MDFPIPSWEDIRTFIVALGWTKGVFAIFFFLSHGWVFHLYDGRLKDRQSEIDRIAADNKDLRDRFTSLLDKHMGYSREERRKKEGE